MITVFMYEVRRFRRRRLSLILLILPVVLVMSAWIGKWLAHPLPGLVAWTLMSASSLVVFSQALLSDREGRLDLAFASSRVSANFPLVRSVLLLAFTFALQTALFVGLARLLSV